VLIRRVQDSVRGRVVDDWAVRRLVDRGDARAVSIFAQAIGRQNATEDDQILLASALLTLGEPGMAALRNAAVRGPGASVAQEALTWNQQITSGSLAANPIEPRPISAKRGNSQGVFWHYCDVTL